MSRAQLKAQALARKEAKLKLEKEKSGYTADAEVTPTVVVEPESPAPVEDPLEQEEDIQFNLDNVVDQSIIMNTDLMDPDAAAKIEALIEAEALRLLNE